MNLGTIWTHLNKNDRNYILEQLNFDSVGMVALEMEKWTIKYGNMLRNDNLGKMAFIDIETVEDVLIQHCRWLGRRAADPKEQENKDNIRYYNYKIKQCQKILAHITKAKE